MTYDFTTRPSIPTRYNGTLFRSKLEASWAMTFDALGIPWEYEKEGRYYGDTFYLVDFRLTQARQWVEVKGAWTPADVKKAMAFCRHIEAHPLAKSEAPEVCLIECAPDGAFHGWPRIPDPIDWADFLLDRSLHLELRQCGRCRGWWFAPERRTGPCLCCGRPVSLLDGWLGLSYSRVVTPWPLTSKEAA